MNSELYLRLAHTVKSVFCQRLQISEVWLREGTMWPDPELRLSSLWMVQNSRSIRTQAWPHQQHIRYASFLYIHFEFKVFTLVCILPTFSSSRSLFHPIAHFLSLLPIGGNRTTADLMSPVFLPSQTCQVTKPFSLSIMRFTDKNLIPIPHLFPPQLSFYHYVGAKHGHLQVFVQSDTQGQITEVWKNSTPSLMETWSRTVITFSGNHSFKVCNIHSS